MTADLRAALDTPMYPWLVEYGPAKAWDEAMELIRAALASTPEPAPVVEGLAGAHEPIIVGHCDVGVSLGCECGWRQPDRPGDPSWAEHIARVRSADDGTAYVEQCGAVHDIAGRCTRDMAHFGAHIARSTVPGHGSGGWLNEHPGEPDRTYVDRQHSDEYIRGAIGGVVAMLDWTVGRTDEP